MDDKLAEKEQARKVDTELAKLNERIPVADQLLAYEMNLRSADNVVEIEEKARNMEDLEHLLMETLDKLKDSDLTYMTDEQRADAETKRNTAISVLERLRLLRDAIASHLKSLADWKSDEDELMERTRIVVDNSKEVTEIYAQPQPYTTAINDVDRLHRLHDQIMQLLQTVIDKEQSVKQSLPECHSAISMISGIKQDLENAADNVQVLITLQKFL